MDIEKLVFEEIRRSGVRDDYVVNVRHRSEVYSGGDKKEDSFFVQVSIGSEAERPIEDCECSHLDFWYDVNNNKVEHVDIYLKGGSVKRKLGGELVSALGRISRELESDAVELSRV